MDTWQKDNRIPVAQESIFLDWFFIISYVLFITTLFMLLTGKLKRAYKRVWRLFLFFPLSAGVLDVVENVWMLSTLKGNGGLPGITGVFASLKFLLLITVIIGITVSFFIGKGKQRKEL